MIAPNASTLRAEDEQEGEVDKPWRIQLRSDTALVLPQSFDVILGVLQITVRQRSIVVRQPVPDTFEPIDVVQPVGLRFDVRTPPGDWRQLWTDAVVACNVICQLLAVVHRTAVTQPRFEGMIDLLPGDGPRMMLQCIPSIDAPLAENPQFDLGFTAEFFQHWYASGEQGPQVQVNRALSHLRASYESEDAVTQFSELWIGMAALNELLRRKFGADAIPVTCSYCKTPTLQCSSCGKQHVQTHRETAVVRGIIRDRLGRSADEWKHINKLRQRIVHGNGVMPGQFEVVSAVATMREALALAITLALKLPDERAGLLVAKRAPIRGDNDLWALVRIDSLPLDELTKSHTIPELRNVTGMGGVVVRNGPGPSPDRRTVLFAMYGYRKTCAVLDWSAQNGSTLLDRIEPAFIAGGAPGEGAYH